MLGWSRKHKLYMIFTLLMFFFQPAVAIGRGTPPFVYDFRLIQATASLPSVKVYADIIGEGGVPAKGLKTEDIRATLGTVEGKTLSIIPFEDSREGIGFVLLVDISKSLSRAQFVSMKETLGAFVGAMSERDRVALISFGENVNVLQEFTANRAQIREKISRLELTDDETAFYNGIDQAITLARAAGEDIPRRRVIISLTDGVNDIVGGVTKVDITEKLSKDPISLYLIGFVSGKSTPEQESAVGVMRNFSRESGGRYYDGRGGDWRGIYFAISRAIRNSFVLQFDMTGLRSEGDLLPLSVSLATTDRAWKGKLTISVPAGGNVVTGPSDQTAGAERNKGNSIVDQENRNKSWIWIIAVLMATLAIGGAVWFNKKSKKGKILSSGLIEMPEARENKSVLLKSSAVISEVEAGLWLHLERMDSESRGEFFEFEIIDKVILGSDPGVSHLVFNSSSGVDPAHCELYIEQGLLWLKDPGSSTGTYHNGTLVIEPQPLDEQDVVKIGRVELKVCFPA